MHKILAFLVAVVVHFSANTQGNYSVSRIPAALLKNANVVKRFETVKFQVFSTKRAVLTTRYALTILNEAGDKYASMHEFYDQLRQISSIEGSLYDANGKLIRKLKNKEVEDVSAVSDISLMDDNRRKSHNFYHKVYPYTVEYEVEVIYNNTFFFPHWYPQEYENVSVELSALEVITPSDYQLRFRNFNYKGEPLQKTESGNKSYSWQVAALPAVRRESFGPKWHEMTTAVSLAPAGFEIQGYKGDMTSWKEFGKFLFQLSKERHQLPDPLKQKVRELTSGLPDERSKVIALYTFMQQNTRYISIQLGIGGWQPFEASFVANKGYGDCKALSNYMYSLLKEAGISSKYALIRAGRTETFIQEDFPSNQFNHAILCVPLARDTVWLECTSQTAPAGYMGEFTGNRKALLIDEEGGVLVSTPIYDAAKNTQVRKAIAKVQDDGTLNMSVRTSYKGLQQDYYHQLINSLSRDKVKEFLQEAFELPTYDVQNFKYDEKKDVLPEIIESMDVVVSGYATVTGKRLFIVPNVLNRTRTKLSTDEDRKFDIRMDFGYIDIDTFEIDLPAGYELESVQPPVILKSKFGTYQASVTVKNNKIVYLRKREYFTGNFPASEYGALVTYYSDIYKADRNKIVLVKKEGAAVAEKKAF